MLLIQFALPEVLALVHLFYKRKCIWKTWKSSTAENFLLASLAIEFRGPGISCALPVLSFLLQNKFQKNKENI